LQALRERQQRLQETAPELPTMAGMQSPWQGAAYLANTLVNSLQQNAAASQEEAGTKAMMDAFGKIDPATGATSEQLAEIGRYDPEFAIKLWTDRAQRLQNQVRTVTGDEAAKLGLDPTRTWQVDNSGKANDITPTTKSEFGPIISGEEAQKLGLDPNLRYQFNQTSGKYEQVGSTPQSAQPMADWQNRDLGYYHGGSLANDSLSETGNDATLATLDTAFWSALGDWSGSSVIGALANRQLTPQQQAALNDALNFAAAVNRKESGASLTESEIKGTMARYIPVYGDSPETIAKKRTARAEKLKSFRFGLSGRPELEAADADLNAGREQRRKERETQGGGGGGNATTGGTDTGGGTGTTPPAPDATEPEAIADMSRAEPNVRYRLPNGRIARWSGRGDPEVETSWVYEQGQ
jgi:hypothetical protein